MSSKLLKEQGRMVLPNEEVVLQLIITKTGIITLHAPQIHPKDSCKLLSGIIQDIQFQYMESLRPKEEKENLENQLIQKPVSELTM